jgi:hypothetical protein
MRSERLSTTPTESTFELATIQRLQALGYRYLHASAIDRSLHTVVLEGSQHDCLRQEHLYLLDFQRQVLNDFLVVKQLKKYRRGLARSGDRPEHQLTVGRLLNGSS